MSDRMFKSVLVSLSVQNDTDCHSFDPGSNLCPCALLSSLSVSSTMISLLLLRVCDFHLSVLNVEFGGSASQYGISLLESCSQVFTFIVHDMYCPAIVIVAKSDNSCIVVFCP